jgi:hypothetical protein
MPPYISIPLIVIDTLLLLFLLYLLSVCPGRRRAEAARFMGWHYAHRGLHDRDIPENSLAAFAAAAKAGYGIELDVQLSRDGVAMVFHDATLTRVCGIDGKVADYTAAELQKMPLCGMAEHTIPTLADVLRTVDGRVPLLVEIKGYVQVSPVCEATVALLDTYKGAYMIESFTPCVVHWFKKNRPAVIRGQLSSRLFRKGKRTLGNLIVQSLCCNFIAKPDFIAFCYEDRGLLSFRLSTRFYRAWSMAWTVKGSEDEERSRGFHDIIFEGYRPERKRDKR